MQKIRPKKDITIKMVKLWSIHIRHLLKLTLRFIKKNQFQNIERNKSQQTQKFLVE